MTHYETLGVPEDADETTIKQAYRRRAQKSHPDRGGEEEEFHRIQLAYDVLSDLQRREKYDRTGEDGEARDTLQDQILSSLTSLFDQIIQSDDYTGDLIERAKGAATSKHRDNEIDIKRKRKQVAKFEKLVGRVKAREDNWFEGVVRQRIDHLNRDIETIAGAQKILDGVLDMLKDYADSSPEEQRPHVFGFGYGAGLEELRAEMMKSKRGFWP